MTELELEHAKRRTLIEYLVAHIYPSAGLVYKSACERTLAEQTTETLSAMFKLTRAAELERQERRRKLAAQRRKDGNTHTTIRPDR